MWYLFRGRTLFTLYFSNLWRKAHFPSLNLNCLVLWMMVTVKERTRHIGECAFVRKKMCVGSVCVWKWVWEEKENCMMCKCVCEYDRLKMFVGVRYCIYVLECTYKYVRAASISFLNFYKYVHFLSTCK